MKAKVTSKYVTVTMTREQAEKLGIIRCANCGSPKNNHFSWKPYPSSTTSDCRGFRISVVLPH